MAKFEITRDHLDYKAGDTPTNLTDDQQKYLVAQGVATFGKTDSPAQKQKEEAEAKALADKNARQATSTKSVSPKPAKK
jgi:hypothetical protein